MSLMKPRGTATVEDLLAMPEDGQKHELVDGEIVVSPGGLIHSIIATNIIYVLATFLEKHPIGKVMTPDVGIWFPNGNLRSPDVTFVRNEKLPTGEALNNFGEFVPDFVVEVLSPSDRPMHVAQKIGEFLECGVPIVWLVDPAKKTVTEYRSLSNTRLYSGDDVIHAEPALPGFSCPVSRFF
ncbi:MAG TPA: Uma2 family endonuclease [Terriglobia bacterium]|nr:Uma2 family endonuclease [Terriglobia bacterium]